MTIESAAMAAASQVGAAAAKRVLDDFASYVSTKVNAATKSLIDRTAVSWRIGFRGFLENSHVKCSLFKTILNKETPLDVLTHYVHVNVSLKNTKYKDNDFISRMNAYGAIVITGLAGSGKSMLMKYITLKTFEKSRGIIPLFIELRHINTLTNKDLLTFIRTSCLDRDSSIDANQFHLAMKEGAFTLILDGFDELNYEFRDEIQKNIFEIKRLYPDVTIVVSSRPDDRFGSWTRFYEFKVLPMTEEQSISVVQNLEYDSGVKRRFIRKIKEGLYKSHSSFLSSPLLTTIMLLTFEEFADLPDRMHVFYSQSFDTLYQKHDAMKDQFKRKMICGLKREEFRIFFSTFCAITYLEQQYSFLESDIIDRIEFAINYVKKSSSIKCDHFSATDFLYDLTESVCMVQPDGIEFSFVHRSFQEYFAAVFASKLQGEKIKKFLDKCSIRFSDSVIEMCHDMQRDVVEQDWVLPKIADLEDALFLSTKNDAGRFGKFIPMIALMRAKGSIFLEPMDVSAELWGPIYKLTSIYPMHSPPTAVFRRNIDITVATKTWLDPQNSKKRNYKILSLSLNAAISGEELDARMDHPITIKDGDLWWLKELKIDTYFDQLRIFLQKITIDIKARHAFGARELEKFL